VHSGALAVSLRSRICFYATSRLISAIWPGGNINLGRHMVAVTVKMSEGFSAVNRFRVSEAMRDCADVLERPHAVHIDIN
jgi:hypothetical protein